MSEESVFDEFVGNEVKAPYRDGTQFKIARGVLESINNGFIKIKGRLGTIIINEKNIEKVLGVVGPSKSIDVTGGMAKKVHDLLSISKLGINVAIFNLTVPGRLRNLLQGNQVICTRIVG